MPEMENGNWKMEQPTVCCERVVQRMRAFTRQFTHLRFLIAVCATIVLLSNSCCCYCCYLLLHTNFVVIPTIVSHLICILFKRLHMVLNQCPYKIQSQPIASTKQALNRGVQCVYVIILIRAAILRN